MVLLLTAYTIDERLESVKYTQCIILALHITEEVE